MAISLSYDLTVRSIWGVRLSKGSNSGLNGGLNRGVRTESLSEPSGGNLRFDPWSNNVMLVDEIIM